MGGLHCQCRGDPFMGLKVQGSRFKGSEVLGSGFSPAAGQKKTTSLIKKETFGDRFRNRPLLGFAITPEKCRLG